jgi:hypothetical protein
MTMNRDLNRLRAETATVAFALLAVLGPDQRMEALQMLRTGEEFGAPSNRLLRVLEEMMTIPEECLPEVDHG